MKPSLQLRLSQHLALTPQLQQSIRLLQLSTLELHQEVSQLLEENPFLETEDDSDDTPYDAAPERSATNSAADRQGDAEQRDGTASDDSGNDADLRADEFGTTDREDWQNGTEGEDFDGIGETPILTAAASSGGAGGDGDLDPLDRSGGSPTLQEHLREQLAGMRLAPEDRAAVEVLLESLNDDGYLIEPLPALAAGLALALGMVADDMDHDDAEAALDVDNLPEYQALMARLQIALKWLQSLEPVGVGAQNLGECLCLQLRAMPPGPPLALAQRIAQEHLELLARRDHKRIASLTGSHEDLVRQAHELILRCEPKPGRPFAPGEATPVVPDVIVRKNGRGFSVQLNPDAMPKLRVNDIFAQAVRGQRGNATAPALAARLQEARWFVKNIQQRFDTILRVSTAIVERQKAFFTHGDIAMKPLVLREIADELGLHESTISRVTTAKYMATPQGTRELKYFFGSSLNTETGGNASSTAVRALLQQFVDAEDKDKPLSDSQISDMLSEQGIQVARRTVAKYRDALRIAPAGQRRAL